MSNLLQALKLISERSGALVALLEEMPEALHDAGEGIESAGVWAQKVGQGLSPQGQARPNQVTLSGTLDQLASTTGACNAKLDQAASLLRSVATLIGQIEIPTVSPTTREFTIGFWTGRLVTGVTIGSASPFSDVKTKLQDAADELGEVADWFETASQGFGSMKEISDSTAEHAETIGKALERGGKKLQAAFPE